MDADAIPVRLTLSERATFRKSGWRALAEFDGVTLPDGTRLIGFEAQFHGGLVEPGQTATASLRTWALHETGVTLSAGVKFTVYEGRTAVAWGAVTTPHT